jgi:hypothetical protein
VGAPGTGRRALLGGAILLAAAGLALLATRTAGERAAERAGPSAPVPGSGSPDPGPDPGPATPPPAPPAGEAPDALGDLRGALARGDADAARAAAAALRRLLRTDASARARAAALLLDPAADPDLRRALALVLGTFGGTANDALLLEVLRRFPGDEALAAAALLALGGTREPEDDDEVFGLGDRPWGAHGPGGIGITVRREIGDEGVRRAAESFLLRPEPGLREAAARALRHSLASADAREAFLLSLGREREDAVAAVLGEALAGRAGRSGDPAERRGIVEALLARAPEEGLDAYRFRMEDDLAGVALEPDARTRLEGLAGPGSPFAVRAFALSVLARSAVASGAEAAAAARDLLAGVVARDGDAAARDLAARLLRSLPWEEAAGAALAKAAREDAAWNVRFTALETLASYGPRPGVAAALEAAAGDSDARVAARARALRERLR